MTSHRAGALAEPLARRSRLPRRAPLPDRVPGDAAHRRRARPRFRARPAADGARVRRRPRRRSGCGSARSVSSTRACCRRSSPCFGVSILLRADTLWVHPLAAAVAISSKFVLRAQRQARLQSGEPRRDRRARAAAGHLGVAGAMGQRRRARRMVRRAGRPRHAARAALGHLVGVPRDAGSALVAARVVVARSAVDDLRRISSRTAGCCCSRSS